MFQFRRLRACFKHPVGRVAVVIFILSLPSLILIPRLVSHHAVARFVTYVNQGESQLRETLSALSANFTVVQNNISKSLLLENILTRPNVATTVSTKKNATKSEAIISNRNKKNESMNTTDLSSVLNTTQVSNVSTKFLIYVCDHKMYCYGLGDRQRGLASVYMMAEVTNRSFGIIMTSPSNFTEFYKPNLVPWDIPASKLKGKSSVEIVAYGPKVDIRIHEIDFNKVYPQDVVYVRTNHKWQGGILKNPHYKGNLPSWMKVPDWTLFQVCWLRLMTPTDALRHELNEMLAHIVQDMQDEYIVSQKLTNTNCCGSKHKNESSCINSTCEPLTQQDPCCDVISNSKSEDKLGGCVNGTCSGQTNSTNCTNVECVSANINNCDRKTCIQSPTTAIGKPLSPSNECVRILDDKLIEVSELSRMNVFAVKYCEESRPVLAPWATVDKISKLKGYDKVNLNLVCVHIRLGHSATLPFENNVRNRPDTVKAVWKFLKPYVASGQHIYLATDSQEVRKQATDIFGNRVHVSSVPIAHIAVVQKGQDQRSAFRLTLVEQLLLATSCKTLVISYSGFSMKAAQIRNQLPGGAWELFMFKNGSVEPKGVKWLLR